MSGAYDVGVPEFETCKELARFGFIKRTKCYWVTDGKKKILAGYYGYSSSEFASDAKLEIYPAPTREEIKQDDAEALAWEWIMKRKKPKNERRKP